MAEDPVHRARPGPELEPAMTGRPWRIAIGHLVPLRAGAHHPENPIQHVAGIAPRPPAPVGAPSGLWRHGFDSSPLSVREVHAQPPEEFFPSRTSDLTDALRVCGIASRGVVGVTATSPRSENPRVRSRVNPSSVHLLSKRISLLNRPPHLGCDPCDPRETKRLTGQPPIGAIRRIADSVVPRAKRCPTIHLHRGRTCTRR